VRDVDGRYIKIHFEIRFWKSGRCGWVNMGDFVILVVKRDGLEIHLHPHDDGVLSPGRYCLRKVKAYKQKVGTRMWHLLGVGC
jgi:hypothetical protein